jgi:predicted nuclease with RNAse H fold
MVRMILFCGIDVGAKALNSVLLKKNGDVADSAVFDARDVTNVSSWMARAEVIAIDAPAELSIGAHLDDPDPKVSKKFRSARCAEIALGRRHGYWVPWVTQTSVEPGT